MTPFAKLLRDWKEKWIGKFYEGPEPPKRLAEMVELFAKQHPNATRGEWMTFAALHAGEAYRSAFVRGLEWAERDLDRKPKLDPDEIAREIDQDWSLGTMAPSTAELHLDHVVPAEHDVRHDVQADVETLQRMQEDYYREYRMGRGPRRI